ncbi:MAG: Fic family protein [Bacteroidetes bacterium]|nr:Fic family protein [Bacteroidota bacterium]
MLHNRNDNATFNHFNLELIDPEFGSNLTDLIIELDYLRKKKLSGTTHPTIFFQLKHIFHMLESIGSARIEGNHTTIAEYIETKLNDKKSKDENILEIQNSEDAIAFIEKNISGNEINRLFISELHKIVVKNLNREGSKNPGEYRKNNLIINGSNHKPPDYVKVADYMSELFDFIRTKTPDKYDLLKTAIAHHRFAWIHPYDNGNGRTVRLLTYAMLVKLGFNVNVGRILNPTAVFCNDRMQYYNALSEADSGMRKGMLKWCEYVLGGLKTEIEKIDKLLDYEYLSKNILLPALNSARKRETITNMEEKILQIAINKQEFMSADIEKLFPGKAHTERSRVLNKLKKEKLIITLNDKSRKYVIRFDNNYLLRNIIEILGKNGFIPSNEEM